MDRNNHEQKEISPFPSFRIWLCGAFRVERLVRVVELVPVYETVRTTEWSGSSLPRLLLKVLLCLPRRQGRREAILDMLWSDADPDQAVQYMNTATTKLRKVLQHPTGGASLLLTEEDTATWYRLQCQHLIWTDVDAALALLDEAERIGYTAQSALPLLEQAAEYLGRGGLLEEESGSWITSRRATLDRARYRSRLWLAEAYRQDKQLGQAEAVLSLLLEEDPTDEDVVCRLMKLFHQQAMTYQALRLYEQTCQLLDDNGLEPTTVLKDLAERLRSEKHHSVLPLPDPSSQESPTPKPSQETQQELQNYRLAAESAQFLPFLLSQTVKRGIIEAAQELGETPTLGKIEGVLRCSQEACIFLNQAGQRCFNDIETLAKELQKMTKESENSDMDREKRDLLKLLGTSMIFAEVGMACEPFVTTLLDGNQLELFQNEMTMRWSVYHGGNTIQAHQGLHLWLDELEQLTKTTSDIKQGIPLLSISYQLHGSLFRDKMSYDQAHNAYRRAYLAADECNNPELKSASLARRGVTFIQQQQPIDAIQYLEYALTQIEKHDFPYLLAYIYQALSEAHAMVQHQEESQRNIHLAEQALMRKGSIAEISNCSSNTTSVTAQKGVNTVLLKDYNQALTLLDTGLAKYDPMLRRGRARLIAQKAEAYYGSGLIGESIQEAINALTIAQTIGSQKTINRVQDLHSLLAESRYRKETGVVQLGTMLTTI